MTESVFIQPIDKATVNRICSGQVILNLATAVKELIENSLDAGATSIQIKLKEYGSDLIEVIDNGCGVEDSNFQALTLKHHTSKISDFNDLYHVGTFGFRGEALSSLCALSDVSITTKHQNATVGTTLRFNHQGIIISQIKTIRKCGTTVKLENLFCTLPIRRAEFLKNLKREFSKMCNVLYAYGLLSVGVRITCTNQVSKVNLIKKETLEDASKKEFTTTVMDTKGDSIESNIRSIFGSKRNQNLLKIVEKSPTPSVLNEFGLENKKVDLEIFKLEGYISSCAHGCGRSGSDRQFFYINSRPIDNPKISKLVNDVYHQFNNHQDPIVVLNIQVAIGLFDVNVTPDKRLVLIQNEKFLLAILKESLLSVFQNVPCTLVVQNVGLIKNQSGVEEKTKCLEIIEKIKSKARKSEAQERQNLDNRIDNLLKFQLRSQSSTSLGRNEQTNLTSFLLNKSDCITSNQKTEDRNVAILKENLVIPEKVEQKFNSAETQNKQSLTKLGVPEILENFSANLEDSNCKRKSPAKCFQECILLDKSSDEIEFKRMKFDEGLTEKDKMERHSVTLNISLADIKLMITKQKKSEKILENGEKKQVKFLAEIKPQSNKKAESELIRVIKKESFAEMEIIGQFNLGFIITKLDFDIFIIDQHASDEKYNFESIRSNTAIQTQKMINPETLELTVDKEELMLQQKEVFRKNGFDFVFDETAIPTKRIKLTSIPLSQNIAFGKDDIDELLFLLEDAPEETMVRPSRLESNFASRACRKSVMIGTPLNHQEMRKIINHMGEIEQPWNCPHGRPTMRHLLNLQMIFSQN